GVRFAGRGRPRGAQRSLLNCFEALEVLASLSSNVTGDVEVGDNRNAVGACGNDRRRGLQSDAADGDQWVCQEWLQLTNAFKANNRIGIRFRRRQKDRANSNVIYEREIGFHSLFQVMRRIAKEALRAKQRSRSFGRQIVL